MIELTWNSVSELNRQISAGENPGVPRLKTVAKFINQELPGFSAHVEQTTLMASRNPTRLRKGKVLRVSQNGVDVFLHDAGEFNNPNSKVLEWLCKTGQAEGKILN